MSIFVSGLGAIFVLSKQGNMQAKIININAEIKGAKVIKMSTISILVPTAQEIKTVVLTVIDKGQRA